eukprot:1186803-Prorocentrum_minimum.AAC.3
MPKPNALKRRQELAAKNFGITLKPAKLKASRKRKTENINSRSPSPEPLVSAAAHPPSPRTRIHGLARLSSKVRTLQEQLSASLRASAKHETALATKITSLTAENAELKKKLSRQASAHRQYKYRIKHSSASEKVKVNSDSHPAKSVGLSQV